MNGKLYRIYFADDLRGPYRPATLAEEEITFDEQEAKIFGGSLLVQGFSVMLREADPINCKEEEL